MKIELNRSYLSIKKLATVDLPDFTVLIGRNGVGKTHLLEAIKAGHASIPGIQTSEIEKYDIRSFQPKESEGTGWDGANFAQKTVEKYFSTSPDSTLVNIAERVFLENFDELNPDDGFESRKQFAEAIRREISKIPDFDLFPRMKANKALFTYSQKIWDQVISRLNPPGKPSREPRSSFDNNQAILVSMAMKLSKKLPHEIDRNDILKAAHYEGDTVANTLSHVFTRYKVEQYSWAHTEMEGVQDSFNFKNLMAKYLEDNPPPWLALRKLLDEMRDTDGDTELFNFEFSDPQADAIAFSDHRSYSFQTQLSNRTTGESYSIVNLSSGEKILMTLYLALFNQTMGRRQPELMLLDEVDALLHPSMISTLIAALRNHFAGRGTRVIMATHSVTTVALLDEGEIFRVDRNVDQITISPVTQADAVSELSEGIATVDTGLKIATGGTAPITILTEGNNAVHLKKWASLFFPKQQIRVLDFLLHKTGESQLLAYGELFSRMTINSHLLIVWDCDAEKTAHKLSKKLTNESNVTAFSFRKRGNKIAEKGIENAYEAELLEPFVSVTRGPDGEEVRRTIEKDHKTAFANHVSSKATKEYFEHFDEFRSVVKRILDTVAE